MFWKKNSITKKNKAWNIREKDYDWYADPRDVKLDFSDVLITPKPSEVDSRRDVSTRRCFTIKTPSGNLVNMEGTPVVASNISTIGTIKMARATNLALMYCSMSKFISNDDLSYWFEGCWPDSSRSLYTMGIGKDDWMKFYKLQNDLPSDRKIDKVMIEVANGYTKGFKQFVSEFRRDYPDIVIFAGTVCTPEGVRDLAAAGADVIRVGIGTGAVCITRVKTGVGYPQLSALLECSAEAHRLGKLIISDGGCTCAGDIVKAFGAGASFVMIGSMLAGTDECDHQKNEQGKLLYYGMSSDAAQRIHLGEEREYRGSEGRVVYIEPKGPVKPILEDIHAGIRSACTYVGANRIETLYENIQFIRVMNQYNKLLEK